MNWEFIVFIVLVLIGGIVWLIGSVGGDDYRHPLNIRPAAYGALGLAGLFMVLSATAFVGTNRIGIITNFGRPVAVKANGVHLVAPWSRKVEFDGARQTALFKGQENGADANADDKDWGCIAVRMQGNATACAQVLVTWQMKAGTDAEREQALELFKTWRTFDRLTRNGLVGKVRTSAQATYATVNPLVAESNPPMADLSRRITENLQAAVAGELTILSAEVTGVDYDDKTDANIAAAQAEQAKTQLAIQQEQTNTAVSKANEALTSGNTLTPEVLTQRCIDGAVAVGQNPAGCMGGTNLNITGQK